MNVAVLVPRRNDGARRDQLWVWVKNRWSQEVDWPVYEGHHEKSEGLFNRSAAINRAAQAAGDWDVGVIADSDTFCATDQIRQAIEGAQGECRFWLAYDRYCYLTRAMSDRIMSGFTGMWEPGVEFTMTGTCSSMVVVHRSLWDEVGGFDERFRGWGAEDIGFSHACQTFGGGLRRSPGPVWHLQHPGTTEVTHESPEFKANMALAERYARAAYNPAAMRDLLDGAKV